MSTLVNQPWTADELVRLPPDWRYEIDEGALIIRTPAGIEHGRIEAQVAMPISRFVYEQRLGIVVAGETGFRLGRNPDTLRAADVAYLSNKRRAQIANPKGFSDVAPELVVEIHEPSDRDLIRKIAQYHAAGVLSVWVIDIDAQTLTRHAPNEPTQTFADPDAQLREPVLPGFNCRLSEIFGPD